MVSLGVDPQDPQLLIDLVLRFYGKVCLFLCVCVFFASFTKQKSPKKGNSGLETSGELGNGETDWFGMWESKVNVIRHLGGELI